MNALAALEQARAAWERTQPQLFLELYPDGLEDVPLTAAGSRRQEAQRRTGNIFEPAPAPFYLPGGGFDLTTTGGAATAQAELRGASQKGV